jgi:predicted CXXCH cytochrome family protein
MAAPDRNVRSVRLLWLTLGLAVGACRGGTPHYVGSAQCASCHVTEYAAWRSSQHAQAMQDATPKTVLGRFDGTTFVNAGVRYVFSRRGDTSIVNTIGGDGTPHDYVVRYTFGVWPLQQYLVELPNGRVQALLVAWDARPAPHGQRWFSLTPGAEAAHTDPFHWTGRQYNWNYMCADCHSTAVRKQYDARTDAFHTTFAEINVSCEACHGPSSGHLIWAKYPAVIRNVLWHDDGIPSRFTDRRGVVWSIDSATGNAHRNAPRPSDHEIETCAQCHARRNHIAEGYTAGADLLDYYTPLPVLTGMYFPDGQQRDEVYTYGSFLQSRMYSAGVTCADCHDPHTQQLRRPGNQVCLQCHRSAKYDVPTHHFHAMGGSGAQCVSCHLPDTTYMQIDSRHDHSIRIPRPDRSVTLGVPNACNRCHTDRSAQWAGDAVARWYPHRNPGFQRFAGAFAADDRGDASAIDSLVAVANDPTEPWMVRSSALARMAPYPTPIALAAAKRWSSDSVALVRFYALEILNGFGDQDRVAVAAPLLRDPRRSIRQEAAWMLAPVATSLTGQSRAAFDAAAAEFIDSQRYNADRAPNRLRLASFFGELGQYDSAAAAFHGVARLDSATANQFLRALQSAAANPQAAALLRAIQR